MRPQNKVVLGCETARPIIGPTGRERQIHGAVPPLKHGDLSEDCHRGHDITILYNVLSSMPTLCSSLFQEHPP